VGQSPHPQRVSETGPAGFRNSRWRDSLGLEKGQTQKGKRGSLNRDASEGISLVAMPIWLGRRGCPVGSEVGAVSETHAGRFTSTSERFLSPGLARESKQDLIAVGPNLLPFIGVIDLTFPHETLSSIFAFSAGYGCCRGRHGAFRN